MTKDFVEGEKDFVLSANCPSLTCPMENNLEKDSDGNFKEAMKDVLSKNIPLECFFASAVHSVAKPAGRIKTGERKGEFNYYYCQNAKDNKTTALSVSDDKGRKRTIYPQPPCLNEEYIKMTYKAFHEMADCFDFTPEDKKYLFKLFNHESHFILNNKSDTGARCYGQLTKPTFEEVNRRIYLSSNVNTDWRSKIYNDAVKKCRDIPRRVYIPDVIRPEGAGARRSSGFEKHRTVARKMDCRLSQHAHTCFFYSLYNIKINIGFMKETLLSDTQDIDSLVPQNREDIANIASRLKKDFLLPIHLNEVLVVKGVFTEKEDGTKIHRSWVMKNDREMYYALFDRSHKAKRTYDVKDLEIRKVKLYDIDMDDKWYLLYKAYNGGASVVKDKLQTFIEDEKAYVSNGQFCDKRKNHFHCVKRSRILENKEYKSPRFDHKRFQRRMRLSGQTRRFVESIKKNVNYLHDKGDKKVPNPLTLHLYRLHGMDKGDKGEKVIKDFVQSVKDKCSF